MKKKKKGFTHIELFAGCGGMSLGLENAGFELFMANELSPMAAQTFAYNLLNEDLALIANAHNIPQKTLWLKSNYKSDSLAVRLGENPFDTNDAKFTDFDPDTEIEGKLLVGSIDYLFESKHLLGKLKKLKELDIDLVAGGPPCQGFSLAGKRIKDDYKNKLPLSFSRFAGLVKPKVVLLENVYGITRPFTLGEKKYYSWIEVAKAFAIEGFVPVCAMLNSKYFGVPQNRPRYIMIAYREDVFESLYNLDLIRGKHRLVLDNSFSFYKKIGGKSINAEQVMLNDISIIDIEKQPDLFDGILLPKIKYPTGHYITAADAIGDLMIKENHYSNGNHIPYLETLTTVFGKTRQGKEDELTNHDKRKHSNLVRARFRFLQILNEVNGKKIDAAKVLRINYDTPSLQLIFDMVKGKKFLTVEGGKESYFKIENIHEFKKYISMLRSKKHSQRALKANEPAPAQLTIPDDLCHYHHKEMRVLTVREMARLQSFPDWFNFRSKPTTGGNRRSFEVPQYTQVGNAVPPLLAYEIGKVIKKILSLTCQVEG